MDIDTGTVSRITGYPAGYINRDLEVIVGLQTDAPLKRGIYPNGGIRMAEKSCEAYNTSLRKILAVYSELTGKPIMTEYTAYTKK